MYSSTLKAGLKTNLYLHSLMEATTTLMEKCLDFLEACFKVTCKFKIHEGKKELTK